MSQTTGAGSTSRITSANVASTAPSTADEIDLIEDVEAAGEPGVLGTIARAKSNSESAHNPLEALPDFRHRLLAERARAISQRDHERRKAAKLQAELAKVLDDLAKAKARVTELEGTRRVPGDVAPRSKQLG